MIDQAIANALKELQSERDRLDAERQRVDAAITALEAATGKAAPRKRGRRPKSSKAPKVRAKKKASGRAPRGLLRKTLRTILASAKAPLSAATVRDKVAATGYPHSNRTNLYVNVYQAMANDAAIKKTKAGYSLRAGAAASGETATKAKAKRKSAKKAKAKRKSAKKARRKAAKKTGTKAA